MSAPVVRDRGQANLLSLAVALIVLSSLAVGSVAVADGTLAGVDDATDRRAANALAAGLMDDDADVTLAPGVLEGSRVSNLSGPDVDAVAPPVEGRSVRVTLGNRTVFERGNASGVTVRRLVLVGAETPVVRSADLDERVRVERRTDRLRIDPRPGTNTTITTARVNGRVVLYDPSGLDEARTVNVSRYANATVQFEAKGEGDGTAVVTAYPLETTAAVLEVTVGD